MSKYSLSEVSCNPVICIPVVGILSKDGRRAEPCIGLQTSGEFSPSSIAIIAHPACGRSYLMIADAAAKDGPAMMAKRMCLLELQHGGLVVGRPVQAIEGGWDVEFDNGKPTMCGVAIASATPLTGVRY